MARQKRIAAGGYKGVFLVASTSPATGEADHIIYTVVLDHFHVVKLMNERRGIARRKSTSNCHDRLGHASGMEVGLFQAAVREMGRGVLITSQNCLALPFAVKC